MAKACIALCLCIICIIQASVVVDAFSASNLLRQRQRKCSNTAPTTSQLHEQPVKLKKILGPISPSTLEKYNLAPDVLLEAWSAQILTRRKTLDDDRPATELQLVPKNPTDHFVDTVQVAVPIPLDSPGLGIELLEIEGGREDGLGIVIVNGLVSGGNTERAIVKSRQQEDGEVIMFGDTLVEAELSLRRAGYSNRELAVDATSIRTECLGYDSTVDALGGMLSTLNNENDETIQEATVMLTLKRLRRRPNIQVKIQYPPSQGLSSETLQLQPGDNLRMAMLQRGIKLNDPLAQRYDGKATGSGNCGGAAMCRTCAVSIVRGGELLSRPKLDEKKIMEETQINRMRLSCRSWVGYGMKEGEIVVQV
eukprot:CAMPEP_0172311940 /NCGR_PEP_ID=MMETSP1058-20130122/16133_1 /TAXON_ID=83371 /ORGANISM="Detonula confervacea, Strain CCMP 353" /LENGTH=365 /DNA_ID=CAMNT_0013025257 /DNA_START=57 /DNA_END=1150 /DNA_ORIENTATION=+